MVEKYIYKDIIVKAHNKIVFFGKNKTKYKHRWVDNYHRKQRFLNPEYLAQQHSKKHNLNYNIIGTGKYKDLLANQVLHQDWAHMSENYPNIIGITDIEIENFLNTYNNDNYTSKSEKELIDYLKHIKCYNDADLTQLSAKMYDEWNKKMTVWSSHKSWVNENFNSYSPNKTIYITSPKGGNEILTIFSYANHESIKKRNIPFDWKVNNDSSNNYKNTLETSSLPYQYDIIKDVNDIVYIDDIFMSGEQFTMTKGTIRKTLKSLNINNKELPRIHYFGMVGNMPRVSKESMEINNSNYQPPKNIDNLEWFSITIGDKFKFDKYKQDNYPYVSASVFPYSIPDGNHHKIARRLYDKFHKFPHRKYT